MFEQKATMATKEGRLPWHFFVTFVAFCKKGLFFCLWLGRGESTTSCPALYFDRKGSQVAHEFGATLSLGQVLLRLRSIVCDELGPCQGLICVADEEGFFVAAVLKRQLNEQIEILSG
jgi:hypothetical protein